MPADDAEIADRECLLLVKVEQSIVQLRHVLEQIDLLQHLLPVSIGDDILHLVEDFKVELLTIIEELTRNKKSLSIVVKTCNTFSFNGLSAFQKFSYIYYIYEVKFISSPLFAG